MEFQKPKILYLPTRYFPSISGAEFYFQRIAEILTENKKCDIDIYTSNAIDFKALRSPSGRSIKKNEKYYNKVNSMVINRFPINYENSISRKIQFLYQIEFFNELNLSDITLRKILNNGPYLPNLINFFSKKQIDYDIIHTTYYPYFNLIIALLIGKKIDKPTICTPFFHFSNPRYMDKDLIEVLNKFNYLIACTNIEKRELLKKTKLKENQIKVIPMGVDYKRFSNFYKNKNARINFKNLFFKSGEKHYKMVLFCGYKNYEKGALSILKALPLIYKRFKKVYFVFIGPPTKAFNAEVSKIRRNKYVRIINLTPDNLDGYFDKKKVSAFKQADIFLMPSRSDAFGIAFLEAWASNTPVIGANMGATPEVIENNKDGLLVEFDNPNDIAEKVLILLENPNLKKRLGKNGNKKVKSKFTWKKIAKKTHQFYQKLISEELL